MTINVEYIHVEVSPSRPALTDTGDLGIYQLKRYWHAAMAAQQGIPVPPDIRERQRSFLTISALGIGIEQAADYLGRTRPSFTQFERWIVDTAGPVDAQRRARLNAALSGTPPPDDVQRRIAAVEAAPPVLDGAALACWRDHGFVVLHDAVPAESRAAAAQALWDRIDARADDPKSWYPRNDHGIMVQYFQHPAFAANRQSQRIHKAFAQLWGTADLWSTTDRVGFNAPERPGFTFPGPDLHWDCSVKTPIPFGTQGILYLTDTPPEQGAFTLVPGFHRWGDDWLASLPHGSNPRQQNLHALGATAIGGRAGDLIIWHHALPHGASPNRGRHPRLVQYINMFPSMWEEQEEWL